MMSPCLKLNLFVPPDKAVFVQQFPAGMAGHEKCGKMSLVMTIIRLRLNPNILLNM